MRFLSLSYIKKIGPSRERALSLFLVLLLITLNVPLSSAWLAISDDDDSNSLVNQLNLVSNPQKYAERMNAWKGILLENPQNTKNVLTLLYATYHPLSRCADYCDLTAAIKLRGPPPTADSVN
jgi:hypothetical protein